MLDPFKKILDKIEPLAPVEGPDKVMSLPEAINRFTKPGMTLHLCTTHNRPGAVAIELVRAYKGTDPGLTLSCLGFTSTGILPVHVGIAKKLIASFCGDSYPTPGPNPIIHRAWLAGTLEIENWSITTLPMRLLAGAMGLPYIPTRSLVGSSMAKDNDACVEMESPDDGRFALLKPHRPDVAFIHAPAADRAGNVLITPPTSEDALGAFASKNGVIVSADRIVSTEFVRRYSHLCRIPANYTLAVCEAPLGAHPGGVSNQGLPEFESYADDYDFILDFRETSKSEQALDAWVKEWIDDCPTWDAYLEKLGRDRIWALKGKAKPDSWKSELISMASEMPIEPDPTPVEAMVIEAASRICDRIKKMEFNTILAGVGASNLAAWLAYYQLKEQGVPAELMAEFGFYGYAPRPADPFIFNYRNMPTSKMLTGIPTIMGIFMGGSAAKCMGSVGAGQIDKTGAINSTMIPGVAYLTGSGGGNDVCSNAAEVVVTAVQTKSRFVDELAYITSPGHRVKTVVSDLGVFEKTDGQDQLILTAYFKNQNQDSPEDAITKVKDKCGWDLEVDPNPKPIGPPNPDDLKLIRLLDPRRQFLAKK